MSNPVKIVLGFVAVGFVAALIVTIVTDRKRLGAAERVKNSAQLGEFQQSCPENTSIQIRHSGWTRHYIIPFWISFVAREIEFHRPGGKWPPAIGSRITFHWSW